MSSSTSGSGSGWGESLAFARGLPPVEVLQELLDTAPDTMLVVDPDGRIVYANRQAVSMFGVPRDALLGRPVESLIPERLRSSHRRHREAYAQAPAPRPMGVDMTLTARRGDGSEFPVEISLSPVSLGDTRLVSVTIRDISRVETARRAVVRSRYNAHVARLGQDLLRLRDMEAVSRIVPTLVASALDSEVGMLCLLASGGAEFVCTGAQGLPEDLIAELRTPNDAATWPGCLVAAGTPMAVEDFAFQPHPRPPAFMEALGIVSVLGVPVIGESGPIGTLMTCAKSRRSYSEDDKNFLRSVATVVASAFKWLTAEDRLRHSQRLEAVGQLTGGIAHDFNNLLTVIMGNLQMLQEDIAGDESLAGPLDSALRAADSAAELTRKLLAFSRRQALRPRATDVNELVGGMLDMIRRTLGERITILAHPAPDLPAARADRGQLETALLNLVVNARDAMPGGGRLSIETAFQSIGEALTDDNLDLRPGDYITVAVSDNGIGMGADVVRRAFDPYFTTKERGKGTGLGLSMVHGFVRQSGGNVTIYSEPGRGTTVRLYLPVASAGLAPDALPASREMPSGDEVILLVEDEPGVRALASRVLANLGYPVFQAEEAGAALALLDAHPEIRLLFTDVVLSGTMDGIQLLQAARKRRPDLRALLTSGYASGIIDGLEMLDVPLLDKPYRADALARAIRAVLDGR